MDMALRAKSRTSSLLPKLSIPARANHLREDGVLAFVGADDDGLESHFDPNRSGQEDVR